MKVALIGASGFVGSKVLAEALTRGHQVTAIVRNPEKIQIADKNLTIKKADVLNVDELSKILAGHDVIVSAFNPARGVAGEHVYELHVAGHKAILAAATKSGVKRFLGVGGAASLKTPDGIELLDSPQFPAAYVPFKPGIRGTRELYYLLKQQPSLDWVFIAPSIVIAPGERTGKFRVGKDHALYDENGESKISLEDYSVALVDEMEHPKHHNERITIGY
jgi:putative NADH-flavin reductase